MKSKKPHNALLAFTSTAMIVATTAHAANLYWGGGNTNIAGNGDGAGTSAGGTWNTTIQNWDMGVAPHVAWNNTTNANDTANFLASGNYTVAIASDINLGGLTANWSGGPRTLSLTSTTSTLNFSSGSVITSSQTSGNTGGYTITAGISGAPDVSLANFTNTIYTYNPSATLSHQVGDVTVNSTAGDTTQDLGGTAGIVNTMASFTVDANVNGANRHNLTMNNGNATWEIGNVGSALTTSAVRITVNANAGLMKFTGDVEAQTLNIGNAVNDNMTVEFTKPSAAIEIDNVALNGGILKNSSGGTLNFTTSVADASTNNRITNGARFEGGDIVFSANRNMRLNAATTTVDVITAGQTVTFAGNLAEVTGPRTLSKAGPGTLFLGGASTYTGNTTVNAGTLHLSKNTSLYNNTPANWTAAKINVLSGATLAMNVDSAGTAGFTAANLNTLLGNISVANLATQGLQSGAILGFDTSTATGGSFTQGNAIADSTGSGTFHGAISVTKLGTGTLVLDKTNTYTGATNVTAGNLSIGTAGSPTGSINSTSGITVSSGAKLSYNSSTALTASVNLQGNGISNRAVLGGSGTIGVAVTLNNVGDVLAPGNSPGTQTYTVGQTWSSFAYDWELNSWDNQVAGTNHDLISISDGLAGTLDLTGIGGSFVLNLLSLTGGNATGALGDFSETSSSWTILTTTGGIDGFNPAHWTINDDDFSTLNGATGSWSLGKVGNNLVLSYTVIPEPRATLLGGLGLLVLPAAAAFDPEDS